MEPSLASPLRFNRTSLSGSSSVRPSYKFRPAVVNKLINQVLQDHLAGKKYDAAHCSSWCNEIAEAIKKRLLALDLNRYKYVVNVVIGENRGEGARIDCRCFWDADTDNIAQEIFTNDSLWCVAVVYGVYYY
ncbi:uncharacterized protein VTP21DRAFT_7141 [Calcarisporiella thermophila]|uniref:uncharacterized protein n=1 Tax=Calcarisporiella thermophila TaxID=911321 RepID=UPI0037443187